MQRDRLLLEEMIEAATRANDLVKGMDLEPLATRSRT